jgi:hypothetical protein
MSERIKYVAVGCGGMQRRHLRGMAALQRSSFGNLMIEAAALVYAPFESGRLGRPVTLDDMLSSRADVYQREIDVDNEPRLRRRSGYDHS